MHNNYNDIPEYSVKLKTELGYTKIFSYRVPCEHDNEPLGSIKGGEFLD
jgi:hypothetical protein